MWLRRKSRIFIPEFILLILLGLHFRITPKAQAEEELSVGVQRNPDSEIFVEELLRRMTLAEKIGQMTQVDRDKIAQKPEDIRRYAIGSVLSGGGQVPTPNNKEAWANMVDGFQRQALASRLGIPLIYGIDAIHGHNNLKGAVIFPHAIGLGATGDSDLVRRIARATAKEVAATGIRWDFAPVAAIPQDIRWGRTYEAFAEEEELVTKLTRAYVEGLQGVGLGRLPHPRESAVVLATPKHYIGDGATKYGTGLNGMLDRGNTTVSEEELRSFYLPPYLAAIEAGAESIMVSYSSWHGLKMHACHYLLTEVLKEELGFKGFLISDWMALDELGGTERENIKKAILAGLDMVMVPSRYEAFINHLRSLVLSGEIPESRINDAVRRILRVKVRLGLFEQPFTDRSLLPSVGSIEHRKLGREAVSKSLVLLKNEGRVLPINGNIASLFIAGEAAHDMGLQSGGWTLEWQGVRGNVVQGVTIVEGILDSVSPTTEVTYSKTGDHNGAPFDVGIAVVAELPYAEFKGDVSLPQLRPEDAQVIAKVRAAAKQLIILVISGRPIIMTPEIENAEAVVAAFLPGSEGNGVADVLFGKAQFSGRLPFSWPENADGLVRGARSSNDILFGFGHGLTTVPTP